VTKYRIHPAIGVARVGDSEEFYLAPEKPGSLPVLPDGKEFTPADFRDREGRLRRQGERFAVYRYADDDPGSAVPARPGEDGVERIEWTVHLANKKASWYEFFVGAGETGYSPEHPLRNASVTDPRLREQLIIDPGPRTLSGPGQAAEFSRADNPGNYPVTFPPEDLRPDRIDSLGGMRTDELGRLIVLGGFGHAGTTEEIPVIDDYANNDTWWDDTGDGPVTARVIMSDGSVVEAEGAWVAVAPPRFAPQLSNLVTLYDTVFDTAVRQLGLRPDIYRDDMWMQDYQPSWEDDIRPVLERAEEYRWVVAIPPHPHDVDFAKIGDPDPGFNGLRDFYLKLIRPPDTPNLLTSPDTGLPLMPYLLGDNPTDPGPLSSTYLTVSNTQYFFLKQWAAGRFTRGERPQPPPGQLRDRAALDNCVGGAFCPGIEVGWLCRNPQLYTAPFRIRAKREVTPPLSLGGNLADGLEPGDLCRYMAVPWQADFNECSHEQLGDRFVWWWPVQRPSFVYVDHHGELRQVPWIGTDQDQTAADYVQFADDVDMVRLWSRLGFVVNQGTPEEPRFVEVERRMKRHLGPRQAAPAPALPLPRQEPAPAFNPDTVTR
jgi:hypothetical protein